MDSFPNNNATNSSSSSEWTVVSYQKPPKKERRPIYSNKVPGTKPYSTLDRPPRNTPSGEKNMRIRQAVATSFEKGSHYLPFETKRKAEPSELANSGDQIPPPSRERTFNQDGLNAASHQKLVSKDLSRRMTQYRKNNKVTQQELAIKLGVSVDVVQSYEDGTAASDRALNSKLHDFLRQLA